MSVAGLLLAAGSSSRLGRPKQLIDVDGKPLIRRLIQRIDASSCSRLGVVVGSNRERVVEAVSGASPAASSISLLHNDDWEEGMASSIRVGIAWATRTDCDAVLLMVCDQPALSTAHIDRMIHLYDEGHPLIASRYAEARGVPALFDRSFFARLRQLSGKQGARDILRTSTNVVEVDLPLGSLDLDTEDDVSRWRASIA